MLKLNDANNFRRTLLGLYLRAGPLVAGGPITPSEGTDTTAAYLAALRPAGDVSGGC